MCHWKRNKHLWSVCSILSCVKRTSRWRVSCLFVCVVMLWEMIVRRDHVFPGNMFFFLVFKVRRQAAADDLLLFHLHKQLSWDYLVSKAAAAFIREFHSKIAHCERRTSDLKTLYYARWRFQKLLPFFMQHHFWNGCFKPPSDPESALFWSTSLWKNFPADLLGTFWEDPRSCCEASGKSTERTN